MDITAIVHSDRKYLGKLSLEQGGRTYEFKMSAKADPETQATDPEAAAYKMSRIADVPASNEEAISAYGSKMIYFESSSGNIIAIHGGDPDEDGRLLPTEGTLRISNEDLATLARLLDGQRRVTLHIKEQPVGLLDHLPSHKVSTQGTQRISTPASPRSSDDFLTDVFFWYWLLHQDSPDIQYSPGYDSGDSFSPNMEPPFEGKGGEFLGAAASGEWNEQAKGGENRETGEAPHDEQAVETPPPVIADPFAEEKSEEQSSSQNEDTTSRNDDAGTQSQEDSGTEDSGTETSGTSY